MLTMFRTLTVALKRDEGQTMAEYAVVLAVIAIGVFVALGVMGGAISDALTQVANSI
jgi:Flp pilus assembly pilin Flp